MDIFGEKQDRSYYKKLKERLNEKLDSYSDSTKAKDWLNNNKSRIQSLFENVPLRDFIFEPFKDVFKSPPKEMDHHIYGVITQVAVINAVLAGLPGRMGVGVFVVMALEGWMAFRIARHVGVDVKNISDIWKYFGVLAASVGVILFLFKALLGIAFSLFSIIPGINPLIPAEIFVTDLVGILFLTGFKEAKATGSFQIPTRMFYEIISSTKKLFTHQYDIIRKVLSVKNMKSVAERLAAYLRGDLPFDMRTINGEAFATVTMAYLLSGQAQKLEGPLGETFLDAIRLRWSAQLGPDATQDEIAELFRTYEPEQMEGVINTIKGKMFEIMVTDTENQDGDQWRATMHTDESFPGSDIIFTSDETGAQLEVSLKAVAEQRPDIIETALAEYPDTPIMTTDEAAEVFKDNPAIFGSGISNEDLNNITSENLEQLLGTIEPVNQTQVVLGGVTMGTTAALWPFVLAYLKGKIDKDQLSQVCERILGKAGVSLASRLAWATALGPLFAWYLLARGVKGMVEMAEPTNRVLLEYSGQSRDGHRPQRAHRR